MGLANPGEPSSVTKDSWVVNSTHLELVIGEGQKVVRFPNLDILIEFLGKAS